jgi:predicted nucleic acid-binding protein
MSGEFIDSNVFVYLFDETNPGKQKIAESLVHRLLASGTGRISFQVVQETINVITRKFASPASADDARRFLDNVLAPLWRIMPSPALYHRGLDIKSRYGYSFYDALIAAAALEAGCTRLYSEDLQHGQKIEGLAIEDPFRSGK